jgi:medium-chain acyl-[acyl-carrier-protein] hydrolase
MAMQPREDRFIVKAFDCRPDGQIKLNVLLQYLQEAAAHHAEQLGVGFGDLDQRRCFWVLANLRLEVAAAPRWGDEVTVRTWPSGCTRLTASREFLGAGSDGRELFRAASEWMILDKQTSRPKNLTRLDLHLPPAGPKVLAAPLQRLQARDAYTPARSLPVPFSSLDFNGHVNNTEYVRWGLDGLYHTLRRAPDIHALQATFLAEVFEGDEIEVLVAADPGSPASVLERRRGEPATGNVFLMELLC